MQSYTKGDGTTNTKMVARLADLEFVAGGEQASSQPKPKAAPAQQQGSGFEDFDDIDF
jgi:hypothetical protein